MNLDFKCEKCPGLKLNSKGQLKKHKDLHKTGLLEPGGDVVAAKKVSHTVLLQNLIEDS